jgi:C-terminal processing protease CtpA/Prc
MLDKDGDGVISQAEFAGYPAILPSTRRQVPLFVPSSEENQRKKKMYKESAQVGIVYKQHEKGLLITGFVSGSDASKSELRVGDVIVQVEEIFLAGLSASEAFELMNGRMLAPVELTVSRQVKNVTNRLVADIIRDVPDLLMKASVGFDFKVEAQGVRVVKVHEKTR